jgi:predicted ribosomally synthesized peptide with SipW-like signal peptide
MRIKSKAIVGALGATAVGAAVVMTGTTSAYFFDAETAAGNTITAGKLDLDVKLSGEAVDPATGKIAIENMVPGSVRTLSVKVTNNGTIPGYLGASMGNVVNAENGIIEPEQAFDNTATTGELGKALHVVVRNGWIVKSYDIDELDEAVEFGLGLLDRSLAPTKSKTVDLTIATDFGKKNQGNDYMTDSVVADFDVELSQNPLDR